MKENKDNRMRKLVELFQQKDEIFVKKDEDKDAANEGLNREYDRLKKLASEDTNSMFKENYMNTSDYALGGKGRTVNSIIDQMYDNPAVMYKPIRQPLLADEAFELSIKRALKSGAPVNDMGFYDEVNWHLMSLGFPAKGALDIKNQLLKMLEE
jgi:hypothetical protein